MGDESPSNEGAGQLEQLRSSHESRLELDIAWLKILGMESEQAEALVGPVHEYLSDSD